MLVQLFLGSYQDLLTLLQFERKNCNIYSFLQIFVVCALVPDYTLKIPIKYTLTYSSKLTVEKDHKLLKLYDAIIF